MEGQQLNATITAQDRLQTPEQFRAILLRSQTDGAALRLGDVARVELGAENYSFSSRYNGQPASGMAVMLATGANALDTADAARAELQRLEKNFPTGLKAVVASTGQDETSGHTVVNVLLPAAQAPEIAALAATGRVALIVDSAAG